jgi:hypothetical protein
VKKFLNKNDDKTSFDRTCAQTPTSSKKRIESYEKRQHKNSAIKELKKDKKSFINPPTHE